MSIFSNNSFKFILLFNMETGTFKCHLYMPIYTLEEHRPIGVILFRVDEMDVVSQHRIPVNVCETYLLLD